MLESNVRDRILAAGLEAMYSLGFNGCSVQDITTAAGVPKGSFYNHFKSKEILGVEVVNLYAHKIAANSMILSDTSISAPIKRLSGHFQAIAKDLADSNYERGCLLGNFSAELSQQSNLVCQQVSKVLSEWVQAIAACLQAAQQAGEIRTDIEASLLASFMANAWEGAVLRSKVEHNNNAIVQFESVVFSFLLP
jgi:TetR/AcrR family transcriptional regulator, transcriptional repressor for nem operon